MTLQGGRFARIRAQVRLRLLTGEPEFVFRGFWLPKRDAYQNANRSENQATI
jgi:hypothetical protein